MNKKKDTKIIKFPSTVSQLERQIEAILFAAGAPYKSRKRFRLLTRYIRK